MLNKAEYLGLMLTVAEQLVNEVKSITRDQFEVAHNHPFTTINWANLRNLGMSISIEEIPEAQKVSEVISTIHNMFD